MAILLEESRDEAMQERGQSKTHISVSEGYTELDVLPFLQGLYRHYWKTSLLRNFYPCDKVWFYWCDIGLL